MPPSTSVDQLRNLGTPKDFNSDPLQIGDHVLLAVRTGELAEGIVVELHVCAVTIQSKRDKTRRITIDPAGCIKFAV